MHNIPNKSRFFPKNPGFSLPKPYIIYAFITRQSYIKYENGSVIPNNSTVHHLAAIYGVGEDFIRRNEVPSPLGKKHDNSEFKTDERLLEVASPEYVMKASVQQARQTYEGIFDGNCVRVLGDHNFTKGQKIIMWEENEDEKEARRQKAWKTILRMRKTVPNDFDYKKELMEALDEKNNNID